MKAIIYTQYGTPDVLRYTDVPRPTPKSHEVLVKIEAVAINAADWYLLRGKPFLVRLMTGGIHKPKRAILGADIAGRVEAVGEAVTQFKVGDAVYGDLSAVGLGGFAEYVAVSEHALAPKPANLSFIEAASVPLAGVTALQALRHPRPIQGGEHVLVNGASGGVGTFALQLAKALGAKVTAVCSARNQALARRLGADEVLDYAQTDFTRNNQRYDRILAINGYHPISAYGRALKTGGVCVVVGGAMRQIFGSLLLGPLWSAISGKTMANLMAKPNQSDLIALTALLEAGAVVPAIDKCFDLSQTAQALRYLGETHASGKVVIAVTATASGGQ